MEGLSLNIRYIFMSPIFAVTNCFPRPNIPETYTMFECVPQKIMYQNFDFKHRSAVGKAQIMVLRLQWPTFFCRLISGDLDPPMASTASSFFVCSMTSSSLTPYEVFTKPKKYHAFGLPSRGTQKCELK